MQSIQTSNTRPAPRRRLAVAGLTLAFTLALTYGCHKPDEYVLASDEAVATQQLFTLTVDGDATLPADGFSSRTLRARLGDVSQGSRTVRFSATAGSLRVGTQTLGDSAAVLTDLNGEASVQLVSARQVATARVEALVEGTDPPLLQIISLDFVPVAPQSVIAFVEPPDSILANGLDVAPFTVRIAPRLQGEDRVVVFRTTAGRFAFAPDDSTAQERRVEADADGLATAHLLSPDTEGQGLVSATVKGFTQEASVRFVRPQTAAMIRFVESATAAPADGNSVTDYTVRIADALNGRADRTVTFRTTHGSFVLADGAQTIDVLAGADGLATAHLQSPDDAAQALVTATVTDYTQEVAVEFTAVATEQILRFVESSQTAPADGNAISRFTVEILPSLEGAADRTVEFETTHGSFVLTGNEGQRTQVQADADHRATAYLRSPGQLATALVTARLKGLSQEQTLRFEWAAPDSIVLTLDADKLKLEADDQMFLEAELIRRDGNGTVTQDMEVAFAAVDSAGNPLERLRFINATRTNSQGTASAFLDANDTPYRGPVTVTARPAKLSTNVAGSAHLQIVEP